MAETESPALAFDPTVPLPDVADVLPGSDEAKVAALQVVFEVTRMCAELEDRVCYLAELAGADEDAVYAAWHAAQEAAEDEDGD